MSAADLRKQEAAFIRVALDFWRVRNQADDTGSTEEFSAVWNRMGVAVKELRAARRALRVPK